MDSAASEDYTTIHASALASSTGKLADRGHNTLTPVIFTEGLLSGTFIHAHGFRLATGKEMASTGQSGVLLLVPRTAILQAFLGYWPYRKGLKVDAAVLAKLQLTLPAYCKRGSHLSTVDKRDAYLAAVYMP